MVFIVLECDDHSRNSQSARRKGLLKYEMSFSNSYIGNPLSEHGYFMMCRISNNLRICGCPQSAPDDKVDALSAAIRWARPKQWVLRKVEA